MGSTLDRNRRWHWARNVALAAARKQQQQPARNRNQPNRAHESASLEREAAGQLLQAAGAKV